MSLPNRRIQTNYCGDGTVERPDLGQVHCKHTQIHNYWLEITDADPCMLWRGVAQLQGCSTCRHTHAYKFNAALNLQAQLLLSTSLFFIFCPLFLCLLLADGAELRHSKDELARSLLSLSHFCSFHKHTRTPPLGCRKQDSPSIVGETAPSTTGRGTLIS